MNNNIQVLTVYEKGTGEINEDFHCRNQNLLGVFDGATSLTPNRFKNNLTGGYLAARLAGQAFCGNDDTLLNLAEKANRVIREAMLENGVDLEDRGGLWCTSAAVVRLLDDSFEWVQIGDCLVLVIYENGAFELITDNFEHDLETLRMWKDCEPDSGQTIFSVLEDQLLKTRANQNVTYGVFNGESRALSFLNFGAKSLRRVKHILLFTDGLFIPKREPEQREDFTLFAELFLQGGLHPIRDTVRQMEQSDPDCREYPRFKTHDDIAAISITF